MNNILLILYGTAAGIFLAIAFLIGIAMQMPYYPV